MIYVLYLIVAAGVVMLSVQASNYVDLLDKKTSLSGAFIGGILLSAVTSLPELFTSISSTVLLHQPGLCLGNIMGSDLFNIAALSVVVLIFSRSFADATLSKGHRTVTILVILAYVVMVLQWIGILNIEIFSINVASICIVVLYAISVKYLSSENSENAPEAEEDVSPLTVKQIVIRFILVSIGIVALSIIITYITDAISVRLHLGQGLAGAIFLGVATSLPELSSTIALFRMRNFDIAFGNIVGSNIFNFIIMAVVDILYISGTVYDFSDPQTVILMICGVVAQPFLWVMMKYSNKVTRILCPLAIVACYIAFLVI